MAGLGRTTEPDRGLSRTRRNTAGVQVTPSDAILCLNIAGLGVASEDRKRPFPVPLGDQARCLVDWVAFDEYAGQPGKQTHGFGVSSELRWVTARASPRQPGS